MTLTLVEWNVQDFFLHLAYPVSPGDIETLSDEHWALLAKPDLPLKPLSKIKAIAQILRELDADLVFLCEVGGLESLEVFNELFLQKEYAPYLLAGNSNRGIESGFLVRKTLNYECFVKSHKNWPVPFEYPHEKDPITFRHAAEAALYYELGQPGERKLSRDIPALSLKRNGRTELLFLLAHLKSGFDMAGVDLDGKVRRAAELKALLAIRESIQAKLPEVPILLCGDFNGRASRLQLSPEFEPIYQTTDYEDALEIVGAPKHERITQLTFIKKEVLASQLDYFFIPKSLQDKVLEAFVYRYHEDEQEKMLPLSFRDRWQLPSDHYPLVVRLDL